MNLSTIIRYWLPDMFRELRWRVKSIPRKRREKAQWKAEMAVCTCSNLREFMINHIQSKFEQIREISAKYDGQIIEIIRKAAGTKNKEE